MAHNEHDVCLVPRFFCFSFFSRFSRRRRSHQLDGLWNDAMICRPRAFPWPSQEFSGGRAFSSFSRSSARLTRETMRTAFAESTGPDGKASDELVSSSPLPEPEPSQPEPTPKRVPPEPRKKRMSDMEQIERWAEEIRERNGGAAFAVRTRAATTMAPPTPLAAPKAKKSFFGSPGLKKKKGSAPADATRARAASVAISPAPLTRSRSASVSSTKDKRSSLQLDAIQTPENEERTEVTKLLVACKRLHDNMKTFETVCEALMTTMIKKEKDPDSVLQDARKIEDQLADTAKKVKAQKELFLAEKEKMRQLWERECGGQGN